MTGYTTVAAMVKAMVEALNITVPVALHLDHGSYDGAKAALEATLAAITGSLKKGEPVQLIGFGTFKVNKRAARTGRNPQTGAEIKIAASKVPAFVSGKALKDAIK